MTEPRFIAASIVTPWLPAIGITIAGFKSESPHWNLLIFGFITVASYFGLFAFGFPVIHFLRRVGWLNLPLLVFSGAAIGIVVFSLAMAFLGFLLGSSSPFWSADLLWGAALGSSVALCFGLIAGITRWSRRTW